VEETHPAGEVIPVPPVKEVVTAVKVEKIEKKEQIAAVQPSSKPEVPVLVPDASQGRYIYYKGRVCHLGNRTPVNGVVEYLFDDGMFYRGEMKKGLMDGSGVIEYANGDVYDKLVVRVLEIIESVKICRQCLNKLEVIKGAFWNKVENVGVGEGCGRYEAPRGEVFHYIRSDGTNRPIRHKVRAPSYVNIPTYEASCKGISISDALITLAAVDPCYCCTERSLKIKDVNDKKVPNLLELSRSKTEKLRRE